MTKSTPPIQAQRVARILRWALGHVTGNAGWAIAAMYGNALAYLALGEPDNSRHAYAQARNALRIAIKRGEFIR